MAPQPVNIDWDDARQLFENEGLSYRDLGTRFSVNHETIRRHAMEAGWARTDEAHVARDTELKARAAAAATATKIKWEERRADEADAAGITASRARQAIVTSIDEKDWHMVRATSIAYGILIDKAQLLTGGATSRIDDVPFAERMNRVTETRTRLRAVRDQTG